MGNSGKSLIWWALLGVVLLGILGAELALPRPIAPSRSPLDPDPLWQARGVGEPIAIPPASARKEIAHPLATPTADKQDTTTSVRREAPDVVLFGKKLSSQRVLPSQAVVLKPATTPLTPVRLRIPVLGIDTTVEEVGLRDGNMDVPTNIWNVGWLTSGPRPGEAGNAVIAGHKDSIIGTAIFWYLHRMKVGDKVYISDQDGQELTFEVIGVQSYSIAEAPLDQIFGPTSEKHLNLITCAGTFRLAQRSYDKRLVVYTRLVTSG